MSVLVWVRPIDEWWHPELSEFGVSELSDPERDRLADMRNESAARRFVAATRLTRHVLARQLGIAPAEVPLSRACDCGSEHGRPEVDATLWGKPLDVSISHTDAWAVVAVGHGVRVGVDVELADLPRSRVEHALMAGLSPDERALATTCTDAELVRWWTRKEAAAKATGQGVSNRLRGIQLSPPAQAPRVLGYDGYESWEFRLWDIPEMGLAHGQALDAAIRRGLAISLCSARSK